MNKQASTVAQEVAKLRAMAATRFDGQPAHGYAFGGVRLGQLLQGDLFRDFYMCIRLRGRGLALEVDSYMAREGRWARLRDDFDEVAWEAGLIKVGQPRANREAFRALHRTARVLLSGRGLRLGGPVVALNKRFNRAGRLHA